MILEAQKNVVILEMGDENDSIDMSLDLDSAQILMQMLSKNLYSDSVGSTIREAVSNSLDSCRRAGVEDPIIVSFKANNDNTYSFTVEDFGEGMNSDDVENIISKYGKSTKRLSSNELGMFGLGFKAPLAYSSSFHFICRKDGMEWKYMMYEGEESNKIDLMYSQKTIERNGVKVIIPVKYHDQNEFRNKIREQLAYFESVYFDTGNISNDFTIVRAEHYQTSPLVSTRELHICLDNIYYPIDFAKLGIPTIDVPLGLRFGLSDGIFPVPNRENIRFTVEAKKIILEKIGKVADVIVKMYNESISATTDINKIFDYYNSSFRNVSIDGKSYNVIPFLKYTKLTIDIPTLVGVELLNLEELFRVKDSLISEYTVRYHIKNNKMSELKSNNDKEIRLQDLNSIYYYIFDEPISEKKREYIKDQCNYSKHYLCKKGKYFRLKVDDRGYDSTKKFSYWHVLKLKNYPKSQWRQVIKEFQFIQEGYIAKFKNIDAIDIPQDWIDSKKKARAISLGGNGRRTKLTGEIFGKTAERLERYVSGQNCKFVAATYNLVDIPKFKGLTVYDGYDNQDKLDMLYYISKGTSMNIRILSFSNRELKTINTFNIHNLISYDNFMKGDNKPFKRLITAYLITELMTKYSKTFSNNSYLNTISKSLVEKMEKLITYRLNYFKYADSNIYEQMLIVANEFGLFDMSIYSDYLDIRDLFGELTFLEPVMKTMKSYGDEESPMIGVLVDLFKYYKHRIDYHNYKVPLNEMLDFEALLTDEVVDELVTNI